MSGVAEVRLWGRRIGAVATGAKGPWAEFQYTPEFAASGIEIAPLAMPLSTRVYRFRELDPASFHGLPGLLADALPDRFGNVLIEAWLARAGRRLDAFDAVERLCYVGARGMGALEFAPALEPESGAETALDLEELVGLANLVLAERASLRGDPAAERDPRSLANLLSVGTSAGGARAKALLAWNPRTDEFRSGQVPAPEGFEPWLLKFDGVRGNRDRELDDLQGYGAIEFAYSELARAAGIEMTECRLHEEHGRRHFMTRRFDRTATGGKLHMQSLAALAHFDFRLAGTYAYEQAFGVARAVGLGHGALEQLFRRMVFNVLARNQDDHVKNIAFLMDRRGRWSLAPAFDVTYAFNPSGAWTSSHQMTVAGRRDGFTRADLRAAGASTSISARRTDAIFGEVRAAVSRWSEVAAGLGIERERVEAIAGAHRLELPAG